MDKMLDGLAWFILGMATWYVGWAVLKVCRMLRVTDWIAIGMAWGVAVIVILVLWAGHRVLA